MAVNDFEEYVLFLQSLFNANSNSLVPINFLVNLYQSCDW